MRSGESIKTFFLKSSKHLNSIACCHLSTTEKKKRKRSLCAVIIIILILCIIIIMEKVNRHLKSIGLRNIFRKFLYKKKKTDFLDTFLFIYFL